HTAGGAGGIYLDLPYRTAMEAYAAGKEGGCSNLRREGFRCVLTRMLNEAKALGTNVLYLHDYWDDVGREKDDLIKTCPDAAARGRYFCKGDYVIRRDLGGLQALNQAIADVHASQPLNGRSARVILYLEPFLVHGQSAVGNAFGEL